MARIIAITSCLLIMSAVALAQAPLATPIGNPTGRYLVWGDYKIEINQYGGLGLPSCLA